MVNSRSRVKKRSFKKFEQSYIVPIAYLGLLELVRKNTDKYLGGGLDDMTNRGGYRDKYEGYVISGDVRCTVRMEANHVEGELYQYRNNDNTFEMTYNNIEIWMSYTYKNESILRRSAEVYSMDDALAWIDQTSNDVWGDVVIAISDKNDSMEEFPRELQIQTNAGIVPLKLVGYQSSYYDNNTKWVIHGDDFKVSNGVKHMILYEDDNGIIPVADDGKDSYDRVRIYDPKRSHIDYYSVSFNGAIRDDNTQTFPMNDNTPISSWLRQNNGIFYTREEAEQFFADCVNSLYDEFVAYCAKVEEVGYETVGRGRGNRRQTDVVGGWEYYDSDSPDYKYANESIPPYHIGIADYDDGVVICDPEAVEYDGEPEYPSLYGKGFTNSFSTIEEAVNWLKENAHDRHEHHYIVVDDLSVPVTERSWRGYTLKSYKPRNASIRGMIKSASGAKLSDRLKRY